MNTKEKILQAALELYNREGIMSVTARKICAELSISPGNFSYHFPDKDQLLIILFQRMQAEFLQALSTENWMKADILTYLKQHEKIFEIQEKYRFFYLNIFEIMQYFPTLKSIFKESIQAQRVMARDMIKFYITKGILKKEIAENEIHRMINVGQILNNFWLSDAELMNHQNKAYRKLYYIQVCCGLLAPFLTPHSLVSYNQYFDDMRNLVEKPKPA